MLVARTNFIIFQFSLFKYLSANNSKLIWILNDSLQYLMNIKTPYNLVKIFYTLINKSHTLRINLFLNISRFSYKKFNFDFGLFSLIWVNMLFEQSTLQPIQPEIRSEVAHNNEEQK